MTTAPPAPALVCSANPASSTLLDAVFFANFIQLTTIILTLRYQPQPKPKSLVTNGLPKPNPPLLYSLTIAVQCSVLVAISIYSYRSQPPSGAGPGIYSYIIELPVLQALNLGCRCQYGRSTQRIFYSVHACCLHIHSQFCDHSYLLFDCHRGSEVLNKLMRKWLVPFGKIESIIPRAY